MNHILVRSILSISVTLGISITLIRKKYYFRPLSIFILLYVFGQIVGYGLGVDILKAVVSSPIDTEYGAMYQITTSIGLPLVLAFAIHYISKLFREKQIEYR